MPWTTQVRSPHVGAHVCVPDLGGSCKSIHACMLTLADDLMHYGCLVSHAVFVRARGGLILVNIRQIQINSIDRGKIGRMPTGSV